MRARRLSINVLHYSLLPMLAMAIMLCGCSSQTSRLTLSPVHGAEAMTQTFTTAYAGRTESGDFQVVLLDDGLHTPASATAQPIDPSPTPPLRQVVEVRVFWRPMRGTKPNFPAAANAAIDWYVFGVGSRETTDMVHYQGTGFVDVGGSETTPTIRVRYATLVTVAHVGQIEDPIGLARVNGAIHAQLDLQELTALQDGVQQSARLAIATARKGQPTREASATAR